jgi:hypothetical protein
MLDAIKRLLGIEKLPEEAEIIYLQAKDEEDAVRRLREEKGRMVRHRERIIEDLGILESKETELMGEGRRTESPIRREVLARQVAEIRQRAARFLNRVDILTKKISVFDRQLDLLRDRRILTSPMPDPDLLERAAGDVEAACRELEELIELSEATGGVEELSGERLEQDGIVREMEGKADAERPSFEDLVERQERGRRPDGPAKESPLEE